MPPKPKKREVMSTDRALEITLQALTEIMVGDKPNPQALAQAAVLKLTNVDLVGVNDAFAPTKKRGPGRYLSILQLSVRRRLGITDVK